MRALLASAACSSTPAVELPISIQHPVYPIRARLPAGWTAEATHADIYPADVWAFHGPGGHVTLILGWLLRGGRHSAMFPGEREADARSATRQASPRATAGASWPTFDVGELAVSVRSPPDRCDPRVDRDRFSAVDRRRCQAGHAESGPTRIRAGTRVGA